MIDQIEDQSHRGEPADIGELTREGGGRKLPLFISNAENFFGDAFDEEGFRLHHCKLLASDDSGNERCLYNGLVKVWMPEDEDSCAPQYHQSHLDGPFFRNVESPYESPYSPPLFENSDPEPDSVGKSIREMQKNLQASTDPVWGMPEQEDDNNNINLMDYICEGLFDNRDSDLFDNNEDIENIMQQYLVDGFDKEMVDCERNETSSKDITKDSSGDGSHSTSTGGGEVSGRECKTLNALNHLMQVHSEDRPFVCEICKKAFKEQPSLHRHMCTQNYQCDICQKNFVEKISLRRHISTIHATLVQSKVTPTAKQKFGCKRCGKVLKSQRKYDSHAEKHGDPNYECEICGKVYVSLKNHRWIHIGEKPMPSFTCKLCSLTFNKKSDLSAHAIVHMKKGKRLCGTSTIQTSQHNAVNGLYSQLTGMNKKKECCKCLREFDRMDELKVHIIKHIVDNISKKAGEESNDAPSYECQICGTVFHKVDMLKKHLRDHAQLPQNHCDLCDRYFANSSNYSKHKKVHSDSQLKCSTCNRKFNTKRMMDKHMECHRQYKEKECSYCKKRYSLESKLKRHVKNVHMSEVKFKCTECGKRFNSAKLMWEHQWEDHGMRKVVADCYLCDAQFRRARLLRAHLTKEHAITKAS